MRKDGVLAFQAGVTITAREREREREGKRVEQPVDAMILATRMHDHRTLLALVHKLFCAFLLMPMLHVYARSTSWN